ncbi:MAG: hypothetical protein CMM50_00550 [Rhodospirillaceae bacterium]|nr:hypothetical protein [Rhodospirillaceae bacterium]
MQFQLQVFEYQDRSEFRIIDRNGEPWFVLSDVCRALEIKNPGDAADRLDDDEKGIVNADTPGGRQNLSIINESGLYSLILTSRKPAAKRFKKWVTSEVLPAIRRTGRYGVGRTPVFVRRFNDNWDRVSPGYFSVISEIFIRVIGRLEFVGYVMPDRGDTGREMRPDISVGKTFPAWLEANYPTLASMYSTYLHLLPNGVECEARQYQNEVLFAFIEFVDRHWIPIYAEQYFKKRDRKALSYLPKILPPQKKAG